jgi:RNA polymerase-binding protein DksA
MRLGRRAGSREILVDTEAAAAVLQEEREKLIRQLGELGANEHGDLTGDLEFGDGFADAAAATAERTEVLGLVDNITTLLSDVDQALQRVADGTYGICDACGNPIGAERMEFRPTSRYCVECKSKR